MKKLVTAALIGIIASGTTAAFAQEASGTMASGAEASSGTMAQPMKKHHRHHIKRTPASSPKEGQGESGQ